mmetsp:Transcript_10351/g.24190  ORF Transcript_10351/g.24190 Transcript_10351/m.24190 type:complete len:301 (+) Transcript_10351:125-1027(+)
MATTRMPSASSMRARTRRCSSSRSPSMLFIGFGRPSPFSGRAHTVGSTGGTTSGATRCITSLLSFSACFFALTCISRTVGIASVVDMAKFASFSTASTFSYSASVPLTRLLLASCWHLRRIEMCASSAVNTPLMTHVSGHTTASSRRRSGYPRSTRTPLSEPTKQANRRGDHPLTVATLADAWRGQSLRSASRTAIALCLIAIATVSMPNLSLADRSTPGIVTSLRTTGAWFCATATCSGVLPFQSSRVASHPCASSTSTTERSPSQHAAKRRCSASTVSTATPASSFLRMPAREERAAW